MPKYSAYVIFSGSAFIGEIEADSKEEAEEQAQRHNNNHIPRLCRQCNKRIALFGPNDYFVEEET